MRKILALALVAVLALGACGTQVAQPSPQVDQNVQTSFIAAKTGIVVLKASGKLSAADVVKANNALNALQAAYADYKTNTASTQYQAALNVAIAAVNSYLDSVVTQ